MIRITLYDQNEMHIKQLPIERLSLCPELKRTGYTKPDVAMLDSYSRFGPTRAVVVAELPDPQTYEILSHEEFWFAAQQLGVHEIDAWVVAPNSQEERAHFIESQKTEDAISQANRYADWLSADPTRKITHLATLEGCTRSRVSHQLRLLSLEKSIQKCIRRGILSSAHGRELLKVPAGKGRVKIATQAVTDRLSVLELKTLIQDHRPSPDAKSKDPNILKLENQLSDHLGSRVLINHESGEIKIEYGQNLDVLEGILKKIYN